MSITVQLGQFEGPLALLLHLIRRNEMDIFNINIHQITNQYMEYIKAMKKFDLELAGDFIAMASTLIHIKSQMLLPQYNEEGEVVEAVDPRKTLVQKLIEYQKFQEASHKLYSRYLMGRDVWPRGEKLHIDEVDDSVVVEENPLFSLITSYRKAVKTFKKAIHKVAGELQSISERIIEIKDMLVVGQKRRFQEFITAQNEVASQVLVTFISFLELAKMGFVSLFQGENFSEIYIDTKKPIDRDVIARVEDYDSKNTEQVAQQLFDTALSEMPTETVDGQLSLMESENAVEATPTEEIVPEMLATDEEIFAEEQRLQLVENPTDDVIPGENNEPG